MTERVGKRIGRNGGLAHLWTATVLTEAAPALLLLQSWASRTLPACLSITKYQSINSYRTVNSLPGSKNIICRVIPLRATKTKRRDNLKGRHARMIRLQRLDVTP
jgi:hypothetical protein